MKQFNGLSDFFNNATEDEKREVFLYVADQAIIEQNKIIDKAKEILEDDQRKTRAAATTSKERFESLQ